MNQAPPSLGNWMEVWVVSISVDHRHACLLGGGGSTEAFVEERIIQQQEGFFFLQHS